MQRINTRRIDWDKIERVALYSSLIMFVLSQSLSIVIPSIEDYLPKQSPLILLATTLLIAVHHLIKLIETTKEAEGFIKHTTFTKAFNQLLSHETNISDLIIVAYTSSTWFEHIRLCDQTIKNLRLILLYDDAFLSKNVDEDVKASGFNINKMTAKWKQLVSDKKIVNLEIRQLKMASPVYFGIINREKGMFGYLWPRHGISGLEPRQAVFLYSKSEYSTTMLSHSKEWFESMWGIAVKQ